MFITVKNEVTDFKIIFDVNSIDTAKILEAVKDWVRNNLDRFDLCEAHSCEVTNEGLNIFISGDEDSVSLSVSLTESEAIKLNVN